MSLTTDLKLAYHMGFDDALAKRKPDASKVQVLAPVLAPYDLAAENAKLRTFISLKEACWKYVGWCDECPYNGVDDEHDDCNCTVREKVNSLARELGVEVDA